MLEDAEEKGLLKPGGTIIEGNSGNTGMGLALVAISKGYKCIFTTTDKQSQSKIDILDGLWVLRRLYVRLMLNPKIRKVIIR